VLPAAHRLHRSADFARVLRSGRRCARPALVVHLLVAEPGSAVDAVDAAEPTAAAKAGVVVSRAVGGSVVRHAVVRRLRALLRDRLERLPAGALLVVRARPLAAATAYRDLGAQLDDCLDRLQVAT
jgi:ribonuclease P protein component